MLPCMPPTITSLQIQYCLTVNLSLCSFFSESSTSWTQSSLSRVFFLALRIGIPSLSSESESVGFLPPAPKPSHHKTTLSPFSKLDHISTKSSPLLRLTTLVPLTYPTSKSQPDISSLSWALIRALSLAHVLKEPNEMFRRVNVLLFFLSHLKSGQWSQIHS